MPYLNIDDNYPDHPKVEALSDAAYRLHGSCRYPKMTALDWRIVDAAYEKLSASRGGSAKSLTRARKAGFVPPLAWSDIDNPAETPSDPAQGDLFGGVA